MSTIIVSAGQTPAKDGAGDQTPPAQTPAAGQAPAAPQPDGKTPEGNQQGQGQQEAGSFDSWPEEAQKYLRELRKENEGLRKRNADEKRQAEEAKLAEQQKWQQLAEQRARERDELAPFKEKYEALAAQQRAALLAETAKWPAEVRGLLPGEEADVQALADAVVKARPLVQALMGKDAAPAGQGQPPKPAGQGLREDAQRRQQAADTVRNRF